MSARVSPRAMMVAPAGKRRTGSRRTAAATSCSDSPSKNEGLSKPIPDLLAPPYRGEEREETAASMYFPPALPVRQRGAGLAGGAGLRRTAGQYLQQFPGRGAVDVPQHLHGPHQAHRLGRESSLQGLEQSLRPPPHLQGGAFRPRLPQGRLRQV